MNGGDERVEIAAPSGRIAEEHVAYSDAAARTLEADLKAALACPVEFGAAARAMFATDASNYRQVPIGIVTPRTREDVIEAVRLCRRHDAPIVARGGGTSLAGQTCNVAIVIDFSRFMTRIVALDPARRLATVEPGCILDHLRREAEKHHLTFGPDPATHDHNTLGGMIGNDSCGVHSVMSGRTADYVERLTILTYDGEVMEVGPTGEGELVSIIAAGGRRADIYARLSDLGARYARLIEARYPQIPRRISGFENLDTLIPGREFNVGKALTGTECSCVLVLDATLRLVESPPCRALALLGYPDVFAAADAVPRILRHKPAGLEGFDDLLYAALEKSNVDHGGLAAFPEGKGWLIAEMGGATAEEAKRKAEAVVEEAYHGAIVADPALQQKVWEAREASLGATARVPGQPETWPGWEDSAVPPDRLGDYLRDLKALMHRHGYEAAVYGHFGDGIIHCRVNFDVGSEAGLANYRAFMRDASQLVTRYGGSLSGEHGDGEIRAEFLDIMYGPELVEAFREFKAIWDPLGRMNPGKAIDPFPMDANVRLGPEYHPRQLDTWFGFRSDGGSFAHATTRCVGVGKCRRRSVGDEVMCPSYLATNEEKHSTRGRAHLLHEMARGETITTGWDSAEVEDALSLCLACKGCRSDCPLGVDMATWKAEFRAHHYAHKSRPRSAWSMGFIHRWARLAGPAPWLANAAIRTPGLSRLAKWAAGIDPRARMPRFASATLRRRLGGRSLGKGARVILWPDTFNNHFRADTGMAAARLIAAAGYEVVLPPRPLCCGRPLYDWGYLDAAKALWEKTFATLADDIAAGTPIVGLEPGCTSAFKDELPNLFPDRVQAAHLSRQVVHFSDFIAANFDRLPRPRMGGHALVQPHCHHHAVIGFDAEMQVLRRLGLHVERPPQGCCGMAGAFGFAKETHDLSVTIGERVLLPAVRKAAADTIILADGFSCREQIEQHTGRSTHHIADLLAERMLD